MDATKAKKILADMVKEFSLASVLEMIEDNVWDDYDKIREFTYGSRLSLAHEAIRKARLVAEDVGLTDLK